MFIAFFGIFMVVVWSCVRRFVPAVVLAEVGGGGCWRESVGSGQTVGEYDTMIFVGIRSINSSPNSAPIQNCLI